MKHWLCLLLVTALCSGCSLKFAYNNLDRFVRWQVDDYLDLSAEQKRFLNQEVAKVMRWHRANHLPQYADYLSALAVQASDGVSVAAIDDMFAQLTSWGEEIQAQAMPATLELLSGLSDEQVAGLPPRMARSNEKYAASEQDAELAEMQVQWAEELEDALERFSGRLNAEQKAYIAQRSGGYRPERVLWAQYRERWQAEFMRLLAQRANRAAFDDGMRRLMGEREAYYGEPLTEVSQHNENLAKQVVSHVLSNLTEKQADRLSNTLLKYSEDLAELAAG